jgi:hypothetical protein
MEGMSGVSGNNNVKQAGTDEKWGQELEGIGTNGSNTQNGWRVQETQNTQNTEATGKTTELDPKVQKTLRDFIGTMTIEMTKQNMNPAKKISMDGDE